MLSIYSITSGDFNAHLDEKKNRMLWFFFCKRETETKYCKYAPFQTQHVKYQASC